MWLRYVDDILCLISVNFDIQAYLFFINNLYPSLKFTVEYEKDGKLPFLDVLIHNNNTHLDYSVYRKPTNSDMYLHYYSFSSFDVKMGVAHGLFLRALRICKNDNYLNIEINYIFKTLSALAYPEYVLNAALKKARITYFKDKTDNKIKIDFKNSVVVPYTKYFSDLKPVLRSCDKNIIFKYPNKLANKLCNNKLSNKKLDIGVYKIDCLNCHKYYIGETGRSLNTRMGEHKNDIKNNKKSSAIVNHVNSVDHDFDFDNVSLLFPNSNISNRHIVESGLIINNKENCVNLNNGFVSLERSMANSLCNVLKLKEIN